MRYLSVCSGIEAATCAWHGLGWNPWAFSEIEPFPSAVLAYHYPNVPNLGDMTKFKDWPDATIDLLVGGTPCQSFSVAGLRKGLADPRGNLMLTYLAIADRYRPRWLVWENVPGVLSSGGGEDFGSLLGGLAELGYGFAYRVLDAQYFGVAQRRRRVFVVGHLGDWRRAAAVLFERHSLQGHPAPRREAGKSASRPIAAGSKRGSGYRNDADTAENLIAFCGNNTSGPIDVATARNACASASGRMDFETETFIAHDLRGEGFDASEDGTGGGTPLFPVPFDTTQITSKENGSDPQPGDPCHPLAAGAHAPAIAFDCKASGQNGFGVGEIASTLRSMGHANSHQNGGGHQAVAYTTKMHNTASNNAGKFFEERSTCLDANSPPPALLTSMQVRRLTPRECERLQGFDSIREKIKISACIDHQSGSVVVALSCLRWQSNASPADAREYPHSASAAESNSTILQADRETLAEVAVHTNSVALLREIRSHGRLMWSANNAAGLNAYHLPAQSEDIAAELAHHGQGLALEIRTGKAESLQSIRLSTQAKSGERSVPMSGGASVGNASVAVSDAKQERFTTSTLGSLVPTSDSKAATSLCSVLAAISGCIPNETLPERFSLLLDLETPYTLITVRGKPAADGPRYKALGNSMAVPVMTWIGERIQIVDSIACRELEVAA